MQCERADELLLDYLGGNLSPAEAQEMEEHVQHCAQCREETALWKRLALLPQEQPSADSRVRFQSMLDAYREGRAEAAGSVVPRRKMINASQSLHWFSSPMVGLAGALALLIVGFFAGRYVEIPDSQSTELAAMQSQLTNMRQLMVLSLLDQQSANERLQGVAYSAQDSQLDPKILSALTHTLRYDSSVDVRLAALDVLSRHGNQAQVRLGLRDSLPRQESPLVQVALIDLMSDTHDTGAVEELQRFQQDPNLDTAVRERAERAIRRLQ